MSNNLGLVQICKEQRRFDQRRTDGLQKLRQTQHKWRQCQRQCQRRRSQLSKVNADGEVHPHAGKVHSNQPEMMAQVGLNTLEEEKSEHSDMPSSTESLASTSSAESEGEEPRLPTLVLQKALLRRNSLKRTTLMTADNTSAKDVISSDVNLAELFDAGEEETDEDKKNKQLASLNGDYMASKLISRTVVPPPFNRTEERPATSTEAATEPSDASHVKEQFMAMIRLHSEEWRTEFPVEVLNQLTAAFESWHEEEGLRTTSLRGLNHVLRYLLGWPPKVLQHVLEEPPPERLCFQNLRDFLETAVVLKLDSHDEEALEEAEIEEPEVLWSEWDLNLVKESFRKYSSSSSNTMPVVNLFKAVEALGFRELQMNTYGRQRWIGLITKEILALKDSA
eukprot:g16490.t1